jgi:hypothetical protein
MKDNINDYTEDSPLMNDNMNPFLIDSTNDIIIDNTVNDCNDYYRRNKICNCLNGINNKINLNFLYCLIIWIFIGLVFSFELSFSSFSYRKGHTVIYYLDWIIIIMIAIKKLHPIRYFIKDTLWFTSLTAIIYVTTKLIYIYYR